jgi:hypothetical protein
MPCRSGKLGHPRPPTATRGGQSYDDRAFRLIDDIGGGRVAEPGVEIPQNAFAVSHRGPRLHARVGGRLMRPSTLNYLERQVSEPEAGNAKLSP